MIDLKRLQKTQLMILEAVDKLCTEHNLDYTITAGTLLGAIRHKGFIPWDDDLDIGMTRSDYERFLIIAEEELDDNFKLMTMHNNQYYGLPFAKVMLKGTILKEANLPDEIEGYGVFIDVFPFDNAPLPKENDKFHRLKLEYYKKLLLAKTGYKLNISPIQQIIYRILIFIALFYKKEAIIRKLDKEIIKHNHNNNDLLYNKCDGYDVEILSKEALKNTIKIAFEGNQVRALCNWDHYLTELYGDYMKMPPIEKQKLPHNYKSIEYNDRF